MKDSYNNWILSHRAIVLLLVLACVAVSFIGVKNIYFTSDYRIFFSKENPQLQAYESLQNLYTKNDTVLFVVAPKNGNVFSRETLSAVEELTTMGWQIPYSNRVDSVTNYQHTRAEGDDLIVEDLVEDAATFTDEQLTNKKNIAINEPLLRNRLISPTAHVTGVSVTVQVPGIARHKEIPEVSAAAIETAKLITDKYPDIDIYMTGIIMMNDAFTSESKGDVMTLYPLMLLAVIVLLGFLLRSTSATVVTLVVIITTIMAAMGLIGWFGIKMSPPTTTAPIIIMTIAIANSVHILLSYIQNLANQSSKIEAMRESLRINMQPVFLTGLTTALGFMSLNFSDAPPFRDLGNIVATGVVVAFILSVTLLPAMMVLLPIKTNNQRDLSKHMLRFADFVVGNKKRLTFVMLAVVIGLVSFIPNNQLNDEFVKYFDDSVRFRHDTDYATKNLTGIYLIEYSLNAKESGGIAEPEYMRNVEKLAAWYRSRDKVMHVDTFTDVMKRLNKNLHEDDPAWYKIPNDRELAAQYLLLYELSLPYGLDLNNQINVDKSATRFIVTLESLSSNDLIGVEKEAQQWMKQNLPDYMQGQGASTTVMFANIGKRNIKSMLLGTLIALVLISLVLMIALRSVKIGLISLVPNLVPAAMAFGLWGILVGQVGLALSVVAGMTIGIVVDDTVHFLSKYLRARREQNMNAEDAVRYAFANVGMALWITSLVLVVGFLILTLSSFELNSGMGLLTAITIAIALAADFLLLPPLLMMLEEKADAKMDIAAVAEPGSV